jgi:hypothetical protein
MLLEHMALEQMPLKDKFKKTSVFKTCMIRIKNNAFNTNTVGTDAF